MMKILTHRVLYYKSYALNHLRIKINEADTHGYCYFRLGTNINVKVIKDDPIYRQLHNTSVMMNDELKEYAKKYPWMKYTWIRPRWGMKGNPLMKTHSIPVKSRWSDGEVGKTVILLYDL